MKKIWVILILILLFSCDPVHNLTLDNQSGKEVEIVFYPEMWENPTMEKSVEQIDYEGIKMYKLTLRPNENIRIGTVIARDNPVAHNIDFKFLEIRYANDTFLLKNKSVKRYFHLYPEVRKEKEVMWYMTNQKETTFNEFLSNLEDLVAEIKTWLNKHSNYNLGLNI